MHTPTTTTCACTRMAMQSSALHQHRLSPSSRVCMGACVRRDFESHFAPFVDVIQGRQPCEAPRLGRERGRLGRALPTLAYSRPAVARTR